MYLDDIKKSIPEKLYSVLKNEGIKELRSSQEKAIHAGLFEKKNLLISTPTASGKTLIAEMAAVSVILNGEGKAIYIVPLKALATEKFKDFKRKYGNLMKIAISIGDFDSDDYKLHSFDFILTTSEKFDSLIRHKIPWINLVKVVVVDEIHLLNDADRGPTLEILLTLLKKQIPTAQIIALSATIGNPKDLAHWLDAKLVEDKWRPIELHKGIYFDRRIEFY